MNKSYFAIYSRSILWARIAFGTSLIFRQLERLGFLHHFSSRLPELYSTKIDPLNLDSYGLVSGNLALTYVMYFSLIVISANFIIGKKLFKTSCFLLFGLSILSSLDGVYIGNSNRIILPMLLMWALIPRVPLTRNNLIEAKTSYYSRPLIFIHFFLAFIYFFTFIFKSHPVWRETGEALTYFLMSSQWGLSWSNIFLEFPTFLKIANFTSLGLEFSALLILFLGFLKWEKRAKNLKLILCCSFIFFHAAIGMLSILHAFSLAMISCWILLLPSKKSSAYIIEYKANFITSGIICSFLLISLIVWNVFPKKLNDQWPVIERLRKLTLKQHWGLVAPAPGFYNYQFEIYKKDGLEREVLYNSTNEVEKKYTDAFLTLASHSPRLLNIFAANYCFTNQTGLFATYKKFLIDPKSQSQSFASEKVVALDCELTK